MAFGNGVTFSIVYGRAADMPLSIDITDPPSDVRTLKLTQSGGGGRAHRDRMATLGGPFQVGQSTSVFVFPLQEHFSRKAPTISGVFVSSAVANDSTFSLDSVDGTNGTRFVFDDLSDPAYWFQFSVTSTGDFNGDGLPDPLLCRWGGYRLFEAKCLVLFGRPVAFPPLIRWSEVEQGDGVFFEWNPLIHDFGEASVTALGDVNGDDLFDLYFQGPRYKATVVFGTDAYN